jgi:hypothetical protein
MVVAAIFWANGDEVNPLTILVYSLSLGNLMMLPMEQTFPLYENRRFPLQLAALSVGAGGACSPCISDFVITGVVDCSAQPADVGALSANGVEVSHFHYVHVQRCDLSL